MSKLLKNHEIANITSLLIEAKRQNAFPMSTPMFDCYTDLVSRGMIQDTERERERFLRVARYLGWNVKKRGEYVYENGVNIWRTSGN